MTTAILLILGGYLMMLEPLLRSPAKVATDHLAAALREAFPPPPGAPPVFVQLLERMP